MAERDFRSSVAWALTAAVAVFSLGVTSALAQIGDSPLFLAQANRSHTFSIPAQPLASALIRFSETTGIQLFFDSALARDLRSTGVDGVMSSEEALGRLLGGTGLTYRFTNASTVTLEKSAAAASGVMQLDPLRVQGVGVPSQAMIDNLPPPYAGGQVATGGQVGLLGNRDVMDTPFNQTSYTSKMMQNQQARSIADVVANDPSVRDVWSAVSYTAPLVIRGFPVSNQDVAYGGLFGVAPAVTVAPELFERVEVLKGPSALLYGMAPGGSIGGTVNLVPKHAGDERLIQATTSYYSNGQVGGHVDVGDRFGPNKEWGIRLNALYRNGSTPVDRQTQELGGAVIGIDYRGERFRFSTDLGYQAENFNSPLRPTYLAAGLPVPTPPGGRANWFQPWTFANSQDAFGIVRAEFDLTPDWTIYGTVGGRRDRFDSLTGFATINGLNGSLSEGPMNFHSSTDTNTEELGIRGKLETGPIRHSLAFVANRYQSEQGSIFPVVATYASNLYTPTFYPKPSFPGVSPPKTAAVQLTSFAIADTLSAVEDRIQLIVGGRLQRVQSQNFSAVTGLTTASYDQSAFSPAVGVVVKPWRNVSLYGNFIQGLQQGPTAPAGTTNAGETFAPAEAKQIELGVKVDFGRFTSTLGVFQIEQPVGVTDPSTLTFNVSGRQRNKGLEWNIFGEPIDGFRVLGGAMLLNGVMLDTENPLTEGKKAIGVPDVQVNLGAEWDASFLHGLTFSGRMIYTSSQYLDAANTQVVPAWTRFDIGARYTFERADGKPVTIRATVENLFDNNYWASASSGFGLSMGAPRTFLLSLTSDF